MTLGPRAGIARWLHATRSAGLAPVLAGVTSAIALTGAAFYTVEQAACADPGQYIRHTNHVEFVGGCVDGHDLPRTVPPEQPGTKGVVGEHSSYMP